MKISRQMRIVIGAAVVLVVVGFVAKTVLLKSPATDLTVPPVVHPATVHPAPTTGLTKKGTGTKKRTVAKIHIDPTLPAALRRALRDHGVVIAVLYAPDVPGDTAAVQAARKGAAGAHVGFAALNVLDEAVATSVALKLPGSSSPAVAVVRRPGDITLLLNGYVDSDVVAQAARQAGK